MSTGAIVGIVIAAVVVIALVVFLASLELRRRQLRERFGPEFDRVREDRPGRRAAVQELTERERRHAEMGIRPISRMSRDRYAKHWELIQATFVDQPTKAVDEADRLVVTIMDERGYPRAPFEERLSMLSVEHAPVLHHYRTAHDIRGRHAETQLSTEDLRVAMVHYRTLVEDLLETKPDTIRPRLVNTMPTGNGREARPEPPAIAPPGPAVPAVPAARRAEPERPEPEDIEPEPAESHRMIESRPAPDTDMPPDAETRLRSESASDESEEVEAHRA